MSNQLMHQLEQHRFVKGGKVWKEALSIELLMRSYGYGVERVESPTKPRENMYLQS